MSYTSEHHRLALVLAKARQLDIATNPAPEALFESFTAGLNLWCTSENHPQGWDSIPLIAGTFSKPCGSLALLPGSGMTIVSSPSLWVPMPMT